MNGMKRYMEHCRRLVLHKKGKDNLEILIPFQRDSFSIHSNIIFSFLQELSMGRLLFYSFASLLFLSVFCCCQPQGEDNGRKLCAHLNLDVWPFLCKTLQGTHLLSVTCVVRVEVLAKA